jgi:hypothetical protein
MAHLPVPAGRDVRAALDALPIGERAAARRDAVVAWNNPAPNGGPSVHDAMVAVATSSSSDIARVAAGRLLATVARLTDKAALSREVVREKLQLQVEAMLDILTPDDYAALRARFEAIWADS